MTPHIFGSIKDLSNISNCHDIGELIKCDFLDGEVLGEHLGLNGRIFNYLKIVLFIKY